MSTPYLPVINSLPLVVTALLFKMEEANLASRAKAQELIQATNQVGSPGEESLQPLLLSPASGRRNYNSQQALGQGIGQKRSLLPLGLLGNQGGTNRGTCSLFPSTSVHFPTSSTDPQPQKATLQSRGDTSSCAHLAGSAPWPLQLPAPWQPSPGRLRLYPSHPHWAGCSV